MTDTSERELLNAMQPYVLLAVSTLITSSYRQDFSPFALLQRPQVFRALVTKGKARFELPDWLPVEDCLLATQGGELHAFVKHLPLRRGAEVRAPGTRSQTIELPPGLCVEGSAVSLSYCAWFRYAAPPYDFAAEGRVAHYVGNALLHLARSHGVTATLELGDDEATIHLTDRLMVEVIGSDALSEMSILFEHLETSISFDGLHLSVSREMFPDLHVAAHAALEKGETFGNAVLSVDEDGMLLRAQTGGANVQA
jgi:hypothetical protein